MPKRRGTAATNTRRRKILYDPRLSLIPLCHWNLCHRGTHPGAPLRPAEGPFGSKPDVVIRPRHFCSCPDSRHSSARFACPLCAKSGHTNAFAPNLLCEGLRPRMLVDDFNHVGLLALVLYIEVGAGRCS